MIDLDMTSVLEASRRTPASPLGWTVAAAPVAIPIAWQAVYATAYAVVHHFHRSLWLAQQQPSLN
jgi:hypothetical protein